MVPPAPGRGGARCSGRPDLLAVGLQPQHARSPGTTVGRRRLEHGALVGGLGAFAFGVRAGAQVAVRRLCRENARSPTTRLTTEHMEQTGSLTVTHLVATFRSGRHGPASLVWIPLAYRGQLERSERVSSRPPVGRPQYS